MLLLLMFVSMDVSDRDAVRAEPLSAVVYWSICGALCFGECYRDMISELREELYRFLLYNPECAICVFFLQLIVLEANR